MTYIVISNKVGKPGDVYVPAEGVNVDALLVGGFIELSTQRPKKSAKTKVSNPADPTTEGNNSDEE